MSVEDICRSDVLNIIKDRLYKHAGSAKISFRTASLWVQYMGMIYILSKSIRAERTGNWALHIQPIQDNPQYMAAPGHNLYTKYARVYLQQMATLEEEHPVVHQRVDDGLHMFRRSARL